MANNRMYLVNERLGIRVFIGKYYPSTGWQVRNEELEKELDEAFSKDNNSSLFGPTDWVVDYETVGFVSECPEKANILTIISNAINQNE